METTAANKGQSLAEYTLIGGVIALVSIGGLLAISTSLGQQFTSMQGFFGGGGQQATLAPNNAEVVASGAAAQPVAEEQGALAEANAAASTYPKTMAGYEQMMAEMPELIETSGASGATKAMMGYLEAAVLEAKEAGKINAEEAQSLLDIANQGHKLAKLQKAVAETVEALPDAETIISAKQRQVTVDGETFDLGDALLATDVLWNTVYDMKGISGDASFEELGSSLDEVYTYFKADPNYSWRKNAPGAAFFEQYMSMKQSGKVTPELEAITEPLVKQVLGLSEANAQTYKLFYYDMYDNHTIKEVKGFAKYENKEAGLKTAVQTHANSEGICTSGNGQDTGTFCLD